MFINWEGNTNTRKFTAQFKPYRSRYTERISGDPDLFGDQHEWRTVYNYLTDGHIGRALTGKFVLGYYLTHYTNVMGLDIDGVPHRYIEALRVYERIRKEFPKPSLLFRSDNGLHAYYLLNESFHVEVLRRLTLLKTGHIPGIDYLPTDMRTLRIPKSTAQIDPDTLQYSEYEPEIYSPADVFLEQFIPENIRESFKNDLKGRRTRGTGYIQVQRIARIEQEVPRFVQGSTNDDMIRLLLVYRSAGLTVGQATERLCIIVGKSPLVDREYKVFERIYQKVQSFYRHTPEYKPKAPVIQLDMVVEQKIKAVTEELGFATQRNKPIHQFLTAMYGWCEWHDEIMKSRAHREWFNYLYPFYIKNRKQGLYPLPRSKMKAWNQRYFEIIQRLKAYGYLIQAPYRYAPGQGKCLYYGVKVFDL